MKSLNVGGFVKSPIGENNYHMGEGGYPFSGELPKFAMNWEYNHLQPLKNPLWDTLTNSQASFDAFYVPLIPFDDPADRSECANYLHVWTDYDYPLHEACKALGDVELDAGFLFAIFENQNDVSVEAVEIVFIEAEAGDNPTFWSNYQTETLAPFCDAPTQDGLADLGFENAKIVRKTMPFAKPGAAFIWPVIAYWRDAEDEYSGTPLSGLHLPACITLADGPTTPIRAPLRENAIRVDLPFGWYYQ